MSTDPRRRPMPPPPPPPPPVVEVQTAISGLDGADDAREPSHSPAQPQQEQAAPLPANGQQHPGEQPAAHQDGGFKLKFCTVCASNNNRSMEAHLRLTTAPSGPYPTISFGTGSLVRLPGPSINSPNVYTFNSTSYAHMYSDLASKDAKLYRANGILPMLERNKNVKFGPERWQDWRVGVPRVGKRAEAMTTVTGGGEGLDGDYSVDRGSAGTEAGAVDVVITCEERCWEAVVDDLLSRGAPLNRPVHVFNVDIKDNHEEALVGGRAILELADALNAAAREERDAYLATSGGGGGLNGFDGGNASAREGFDERVPDILASWQDKWPTLPALWTLAWF